MIWRHFLPLLLLIRTFVFNIILHLKQANKARKFVFSVFFYVF